MTSYLWPLEFLRERPATTSRARIKKKLANSTCFPCNAWREAFRWIKEMRNKQSQDRGPTKVRTLLFSEAIEISKALHSRRRQAPNIVSSLSCGWWRGSLRPRLDWGELKREYDKLHADNDWVSHHLI